MSELSKGIRVISAGLAVGIGLIGCSSGEATAAIAHHHSARSAKPYTGKPFKETVQFAAYGFKYPERAAGKSSMMDVVGHVIMVKCVEYGPVDVAPSVNGAWYKDTSPGALHNYYIAANTFINASNLSLPLSEQNAIDPKRAHDLCPGSPKAPQQ